jgi:ethanolamine utilization protein EutN
MLIGKVVGNIVSTRKVDGLKGQKLLIVEVTTKQQEIGTIVAVDTIGAGINDEVIVCVGEPARFALRDHDQPIDAVIVGIVDHKNESK